MSDKRQEAKRIAELIGSAKKDLMTALRMAELEGFNATDVRKLDRLCGTAETVQWRFSALGAQ